MILFIDESGDLGFSNSSSKHFIIAILLTNEVKQIKNCILKVRKERLPKKYKLIPELKFNNSSREIRERILECVVKKEIKIFIGIVRKEKVNREIFSESNIIFNYLLGLMIEKISLIYKCNLQIFIDKSLSSIHREDFNQYVAWKVLISSKNPFPYKLEIYHVDSKQDYGIQVVDFIAGAVFRKYEHGDDYYYNIFKEKIISTIEFRGDK